jgi:integral membrane protein
MLKLFRITAYLEGTSFLVLLLIAMPLKYYWEMPMAVRIVGSAHGALFVAYCVLLAAMWSKYRWSVKIVALAFISAFLPAGPFVFDHKVLSHHAEKHG